MVRQEYYEKYDEHVRLNLDQKHRLEKAVAAVVEVLRDAGIRVDERSEPMSDVFRMHIGFPANGVVEGFGLDICSEDSCYIVVAMEPEPGREAAEEHVMNEEGRARTP